MDVTYSLFPKMLSRLSADDLADLARDIGFDGVDLVVRDGFWVTPGGLAREAADFVAAMRRRGVRVEFATTSYTPHMLLEDSAPLHIMADLGITAFRMGYFSYHPAAGIREQLEAARAQMEKLAELCAAARIKAVYQVHHGYAQLVQHSLAALAIVQGLPAEHVGVMLDPGNQFHEGREHLGKAIRHLGAYFAGIGVKDVLPRLDPDKRHLPGKGWSAIWTPCHEGVTNWHEIGGWLRELNRPVLVNVQPFYYADDPKRHADALKQEFAYIRQAFGEAGSA